MDITSLFKSVVRNKVSQNKALNLDHLEHDSLFRKKIKCQFILKFKDLVKQISGLRDFLLENRKSYMKLSSTYITNDEMSEYDRDCIDNEAQSIIKTCSQLISTYKKEMYNLDTFGQELENRKAILDLIDTYLKTVCKIYTEQKAIRVKWTIEMQKMSKLESNRENSRVETKLENLNINSEEIDIKKSDENKRQEALRYSTFNTVNEIEEHPLSEEEIQMFEMENQQLYNDLNSLNDEVRDIQSKVIKIAELQEVFTEKVLEQTDEIERISSTLVGTTENLKDANAQIRQAIQSNASLRIYILFFLLVMSFSLLFLDWYND